MGQWNPNRIENALAGAAFTPAIWTNALDIVSNETGANGAVLVPLSSDVLPMIPLTARNWVTLLRAACGGR